MKISLTVDSVELLMVFTQKRYIMVIVEVALLDVRIKELVLKKD